MSRSHPNNAVQKRQRRARLLHSVYSWHRWLGLSVLLWVLVFSISGLLIEASPALQLDKRAISSPLLLDRYGVKPPSAISSWATRAGSVTQWDQGISLETKWLFQPDGQTQSVVGVVPIPDFLLVATPSKLLLYQADGTFIDAMPAPEGSIKQAGLSAKQTLTVETTAGYFQADEAFLTWQASAGNDTQWSRPSDQTPETTPIPQHDITVERLLLDIHSGALFGPVGRWLSRLAAVVMILLALTGFYTWFSRFWRRG